MSLDKKTQILVAIYCECQKDRPQTDAVTPEVWRISGEVFNACVADLTAEELLKNADFTAAKAGLPASVSLANARITHQGIARVEEELEIKHWWEPARKVEHIKRKLSAAGLAELANFCTHILEEIIREA